MFICNVGGNGRISLYTDGDVFIVEIQAGIDYQHKVGVRYSSINGADISLLTPEDRAEFINNTEVSVNAYWSGVTKSPDPRDIVEHLLAVCMMADRNYNRLLIG